MAILADFRDSQKKAERAEPASKFETHNHAREFGRDSILTFVWIMVAIGFLDTLADPEEGRRVLTSCGVKLTRLRSTLTALLVWFVLVSLVRTLALTVFEVVTDFNAERGNPENGKV